MVIIVEEVAKISSKVSYGLAILSGILLFLGFSHFRKVEGGDDVVTEFLWLSVA